MPATAATCASKTWARSRCGSPDTPSSHSNERETHEQQTSGRDSTGARALQGHRDRHQAFAGRHRAPVVRKLVHQRCTQRQCGPAQGQRHHSGHAQRPAARRTTRGRTGLSGFDVPTWFGIVAPANLPPAVAATLHRAITAVLGPSEVADRFAQIGAEPTPMAAERLAGYIRAENERWAKVIRDARITLE